ncbi:TPA: glycosyltransferase family 2 protein [Candidatus Poribacteria bacterium]|jgi:glycosyltransferase involved in cell wall biosynthesis|nr:glycosyltransferase family 2 protein [Candidatus Poribacteria bacterium]HIB92374.1 glycosyltransferase family 2 protein [Candidatus Poribacteria bacterium]HIC02182.1 glycosyltransferase family 2 protein [Candidatus Poribacteria bacterium]HIN30913.1 glycosyltransferase family 2 protein [Candidatus Poribacteria bacterium]HIO05702.1 glycosyltransferase family 2 protein [Candidatus Poribacteria bacterium]
MVKLSVIIPAFNEDRTIRNVVQAVRTSVQIEKEIIIVNDGSTDRTFEILEDLRRDPEIKVIHQQQNRGKGYAIRLGLSQAAGEYVVIQDADMEVDPSDLPAILKPLLDKSSQIVYGSRFINGRNNSTLVSYIANYLLAHLVNLLYNTRITDESTGYKAFTSSLIKSVDLQCEGFEFCAEVTAKVLQMQHHIHEVPISYFPRKKNEGKKLRFWRDGLTAVWILIKYRFKRTHYNE